MVRYINLDAPELAKGPKGQDACFAQEAKKRNEDLVLGQEVELEFDENERDRFGRYLAYVFVHKDKERLFVNEVLLKEGMAVFFLDTVNLRYQAGLVEAAQVAHEEGKGLWSTCAPDPEIGCQIKGNLDKWDHRWYHLPNFRHYHQITINLERGDRWFCSEEEAIAAGFKRARD